MAVDMFRSYKYRIYANDSTINNANEWIARCRHLYNAALEQRIWAYKGHRKTVTYGEQQKELTELRKEYDEYRAVSVLTERDVLRKLDQAFSDFFKRCKKGVKHPGFPRFKSNYRYNHFILHDQGWVLDGKYLTIRNLGKFKLRLSRPIKGTIRTVTIKRTATNKWYACICCRGDFTSKLPMSKKTIGIDVGIKSYLVDSNGHKVDNPKFLKNTLGMLRIKNRKLARAEKKSNHRKDTRLQVDKLYEKVTNQRNDFLHKLALDYVNKYGVIKVEALQVRNMLKNPILSLEISDCCWSMFFKFLTYKAEDAGRKVIKVQSRNTSKRCNICGAINHELKLKDRVWVCKECGNIHNRDKNAAINIVNSEVRAEPSVANVSGYTKRKPRIVTNTSANKVAECLSLNALNKLNKEECTV